jgi:hypothetical protein
MDFKVVDIPEAPEYGVSAPIVAALIENLGKALELSLDGKDANSFRKTIRATLSNRGLLETYSYRTQVSRDKKTMIVWLLVKDADADAEESAQEKLDFHAEPTSILDKV